MTEFRVRFDKNRMPVGVLADGRPWQLTSLRWEVQVNDVPMVHVTFPANFVRTVENEDGSRELVFEMYGQGKGG